MNTNNIITLYSLYIFAKLFHLKWIYFFVYFDFFVSRSDLELDLLDFHMTGFIGETDVNRLLI